ncbi:MAG TPA: hypothetical protein VGL69_12900 [Solirubrobacteraceae bacterium]
MSANDRVTRLGAVAVTMACGLALVGCGGSGSSGGGSGSSGAGSATATGGATAPATATTSTSTTSTPSHPRHKRPRRVVHGPRVGARQGVHTDGTYLTVTILRVLDLTNTGSPKLPGTRQVGVELRIANQAGATYDSTASGDFSLVVSAGQSEPLDIRRGVCETPLQDFESIVSAGSVRTGCVAFSVLKGARVIGVRFSPHSRPRGALTWRAG